MRVRVDGVILDIAANQSVWCPPIPQQAASPACKCTPREFLACLFFLSLLWSH